MRLQLTKTVLIAATAALLANGANARDGLKAAGYYISAKTPEVTGQMVVNGYSPQQVMGFIRSDCAGNRIGQFALVGKPKKRRGLLLQAFVTSCPGGPHARFQGTRKVAIEVERTPQGQDLAEFTYGLNGNIQYERSYK